MVYIAQFVWTDPPLLHFCTSIPRWRCGLKPSSTFRSMILPFKQWGLSPHLFSTFLFMQCVYSDIILGVENASVVAECIVLSTIQNLNILYLIKIVLKYISIKFTILVLVLYLELKMINLSFLFNFVLYILQNHSIICMLSNLKHLA